MAIVASLPGPRNLYRTHTHIHTHIIQSMTGERERRDFFLSYLFIYLFLLFPLFRLNHADSVQQHDWLKYAVTQIIAFTRTGTHTATHSTARARQSQMNVCWLLRASEWVWVCVCVSHYPHVLSLFIYLFVLLIALVTLCSLLLLTADWLYCHYQLSCFRKIDTRIYSISQYQRCRTPRTGTRTLKVQRCGHNWSVV